MGLLADQRRLLGEEEFTRLLGEQLDAEDVAVVLAAVVPSAEAGEDFSGA